MRIVPVLILIGCVSDGTPADYAQALDNAMAEQGLDGLAMAVLHHDDPSLWTGAVGYADRIAETPWEPTHTSRMGSVTKTFTAAIVHQLVDEGVVGLDDALESWVPNTWAGVTVGDLLAMSSGIVSYNYIGNFDDKQTWTPQDLVDHALLHGPTLRFEPGTTWEYSNTNYVLLGMIIEAATNDTYAQQVRTRLTEPLGLDSIYLAGDGEPDADTLVRCYDASGADLQAVHPSFGWAAGSLVSTPRDLARWNDALYHGNVLSPEARARLVTPLGLTGPDHRPYGMGAFHEGEGDETVSGHTGGIAGYLTYAYTLEEQQVTLVVMANEFGVDIEAAATHGWAAILGVRYP